MITQIHVHFSIVHKLLEYREVWRLVQEGMCVSENYSGLLTMRISVVLLKNVIKVAGYRFNEIHDFTDRHR